MAANYVVLKTLGRGSYGDVFLVRKKRDRRQYVMKNIRLSSVDIKERSAATQEASLLSQLHHPNIVSYHESFQDDKGVLHIIMGYCEGGDLCTRIQNCKGKLLSEGQVVEWFVQIALALQYLHERKIMHRDLKTQNIFLSRNNVIKVGDLGIARVLDGSLDLAHTIVGTPYYMSPELFANRPYSFKSDVWALGCCVYEMATLKHAFSARNISALMYKILKGQVPPLPGCFSRELNSLVCHMLSQEAEQRPSVQDILRLNYVRFHISQFLQRAVERRERKRRPHPPAAAAESELVDKEAKVNLTSSSVTELSSAREKRRRSKQEARGHVILTSQSASSVIDSTPSTPAEETDDSGQCSEDVISLLDKTLQLPDSVSPCNQTDHTAIPQGLGTVGRLKERVLILTRECLKGLGEQKLSLALELLDSVDPDQIELEMSKLLGEDNCLTYLAKLQQLKLCQESL